MPHDDRRPACQVSADLASLRVAEVIDRGVRLRISCDNCQHETVWTQGYMDKKLRTLRTRTLSHVASKLRCGGCRSNYVRVWRG